MNDETITDDFTNIAHDEANQEHEKVDQLRRDLSIANETITVLLAHLAGKRSDMFENIPLNYAVERIKELESQIAERAAALCQSCPLLAGSADLLGVINALRLQRMEAEATDELHKRAAVTLGKFYLSAQTRQALDDLRTCEYEV